MKTPNKEQLEFWREHILKADQYLEGKQAYCVANNLPESTFYKWRIKIFGKNKKVKSPFLPVAVSAPELRQQACPQKNNLPDARWVAEIITNVIRGLA